MGDEFSIQQTLNRYSEAASRAAWDEVANTYTPDGVWVIPALELVYEGRDAIRKAIIDFTADWDYAIQINGGGVISVSGDKAHARSAIREIGKFSGQDLVFETLGIYIDELCRTPDGWLFSRRAIQRRGKHYYAVGQEPI